MAVGVVGFTGATIAYSINRCPYTGRLRLSMTSPAEDVEVGHRLSRTVMSELPPDTLLPVSHPLTRICQSVVDRIVVDSGDVDSSTDVHFKIMIVSDSRKNAISLPNGDIIVFAGLIASVTTEDELAALLAHEMAHTILRHSSEVVAVSDIARIPSGFLYSAVAVSGSGILSSAFRWLAVKMTQPERFLTELPMSRKLESEADLMGLELMARAGFNPGAVVDYWSRQEGGGGRCMSMASTHPHNGDRLIALRDEVDRIKVLYADRLIPADSTPGGKPERRWWWWSGNAASDESEETLTYWIHRIGSELARMQVSNSS